jgi:hypothetical protein
MKKIFIICIALTLLVTGAAMAEPGIPKVNEVQGLSTSTTVFAAGNFNAASSVDLVISRVIPIPGIPGPEWNGTQPEETIYQTVYTEDTQNAEVGFISYDKDLDLSTANKVRGSTTSRQSNRSPTLASMLPRSSPTTTCCLMEQDGAASQQSELSVPSRVVPIRHSVTVSRPGAI